ncbi:HsdM family class I SAM-dependent methyltransferase [Planomicrobium okeanokoites]|uniref:HsdM family class I SAM-dependent methyltransferase n=1 Tax=Planomicrobium okeanokoites TaxID=244 RepID=UPI0030F73061
MKKHINETKTEDLIMKKLLQNGFPEELVEKRNVRNPEIRNLLKRASKKIDSLNRGYPDLYTPLGLRPDFIVISECKGDTKFHESSDRSNAAQYSVDGVLHYAKFLSKEFNVIAIGASGMNEDELEISTFFWPIGQSEEAVIDLELNTITSPQDYLNKCIYTHAFKRTKMFELNKLSRELHNYMRDYAKLAENEKPLLIGAIILALMDASFEAAYKFTENDRVLAPKLFEAITGVLKRERYDVNENKREKILAAFSFLNVHPELTKNTSNIEQRVLYKVIHKVATEILPIINIYHDYDMVGDFYREFLRYTGGDKKSLGIVLTPPHITDLFAELGDINVKDIVLDTCTGTGSFLISAYNYMKNQAQGDPEVIKAIRNRLIGVEQQPQMFALLSINMILRDIPLTNMYADNSFDILPQLSMQGATFGPQNPPYAQKGDGLSELDYFKSLADCITVNGRAIAIVPLSTIISSEFKELKRQLLKNHTLEAVLSMPDDLFYPVGTITCVMVFKIGTPHTERSKTWFAYCKNDGFVKTKNAGRIDLNNDWSSIKDNWVDAFHTRTEIPGFSVLKHVDYSDEWIAEAYIETDYSTLALDDFEQEVKKYALFKILNEIKEDVSNGEEVEELVEGI